MNNSQKTTTKAIALFLSLGMISSLTGCEIGNTGEGGEDGTTEQTTSPQDKSGEGGEGGEGS